MKLNVNTGSQYLQQFVAYWSSDEKNVDIEESLLALEFRQ